MDFYVGLHQPSDAKHFDRCFISINRLKTRKSDFEVNDWILDSGAFTQVNKGYKLGLEYCNQDSGYSMNIREYAEQIARWSRCGNLIAACAQDFMCEDFMFQHATNGETGEPLTAEELWALDDSRGANIPEHQQMTVSRYLALRRALWALGCDTHVMPVLQGYAAEDYVAIVDLYDSWGALPEGCYVGVGSVCKRNTNVDSVLGILGAILERRPDLQLHGFGLKRTALEDPAVVGMLASSDSMAWSFAARYEGRNGNDWREAKAYEEKIKALVE